MKRLQGKDLLLVGLTLFSMFFGAGNLIFPPFMGALAGANGWSATFGFVISAIGFPILGIIAVARLGNLANLVGRVGKGFSVLYIVLIYLSIGPCLAIPRTASTSFEMAIPPFLAGDQVELIPIFQRIYSVVFFGLALLLAMHPEKLSDRLGKILCPTLLILIAVMFVGCLIAPPEGGYGAVQTLYQSHPITQGFQDGYQTMDTIAALAFGIVIILTIHARGVTDRREMVRGAVKAGAIAGALLLVVYAALSHVGAMSTGAYPGMENGAQVLSHMMRHFYGSVGVIILAAIFIIACFNVCVSLISSCGEYFSTLIPRIPYKVWAIIFGVLSLAIANVGLNTILEFSVPILTILYPVAIVMILMSFFNNWLDQRARVYPVTIAFTGVTSVLLAAAGYVEPLKEIMSMLPLFELGLGWVLPAVIGLVIGLLLPAKQLELED